MSFAHVWHDGLAPYALLMAWLVKQSSELLARMCASRLEMHSTLMKFNNLVDLIDTEYGRRGDTLGWRWLYSPRQTLSRANVALVGLNPGGGSYEPPVPSCEQGSAYTTESWGGLPPGHSTLQRQILSLYSCLGVKADDVLSGNLVPFRSRSWEALRNRSTAVTFGQRLWQEVFTAHRPEMIIAMGNTARDALVEVLGAYDRKYVTVNWGSLVGTYWTLPKGGRLVGLPHLSRYGIITRAVSQSALLELFGERYDKDKKLPPSLLRFEREPRESATDLTLAVPQPEG